ncbi:MAG: thioredoxin-disulfide reductase [Chloroflexi bacterium]|nr:thioredoxin-disulfide reductase [Chloroflexota bacterium]
MAGLGLSLNLSDLGDKPNKSEPGQVVERDLIIIGSGPAGLSAAIYAGRSERKPLVIAGQTFGGQAALTAGIENYPGFQEGIGGLNLIEQMIDQAKKFGADIIYDDVTEFDSSGYPYTVKTLDAVFQARAIIITTGASPRKLGVPGESKFFGRGVSTCATCDGYFYKDREVVVVGGGDSALDESIYLTRFASSVTVIHRRDALRASAILQERAFANEKIHFVWNSVLEEVLGDRVVSGVKLRDVKTGEMTELACDGVFIYVGLVPSTQLFAGQLELDKDGYIITDRKYHTNIPGVFAAGDVQDPHFRQVVVAAGSGAAAAIEADHFLAEKDYEAGKVE